MIRAYLENRKEKLNEAVAVSSEKYEHNKIYISEGYNKIKELESMVDEASEIFSVKAREDSGFNRQEISEIEIRITEYSSRNKELKERINTLQKEIEIIEKCLEEVSDNNVSRETLNNVSNKGILNKLVFCRDIVEIDTNRAIIELDNIINSMK